MTTDHSGQFAADRTRFDHGGVLFVRLETLEFPLCREVVLGTGSLPIGRSSGMPLQSRKIGEPDFALPTRTGSKHLVQRRAFGKLSAVDLLLIT